MTGTILSSWQKTKLKRKTGDRKKEIEKHFGIKSKTSYKQIEGKSTVVIDSRDLETKPEKMLDIIAKRSMNTKSKKKSK